MAKFLTNDDMRLLQEVITAYKDGRINPPIRVSVEETWNKGEDHQSPEVYVALPPQSGILPLMPGVNGAPDRPGVGICDIYLIRDVGDDTELVVVGFAKKVYNLLDSVIPRLKPPCDAAIDWIGEDPGETGTATDTGTGTGTSRFWIEGTGVRNWIAVKRTKYGKWIVDQPYSICTPVGTGTDCDEDDQLEFVSSVSFDEESCELTWCTKIACFAPGTLIWVSEAECGGAGT